jgi:hypothetical protein
MIQPLYSAINLTDIRSQLIEEFDGNLNIPIPETFYIVPNLLDDFNNRNFTPENINSILSLCDYLMIYDTIDFVRFNMEVSNNEYILSEYHMTHYNIPRKTRKTMTNSNIAKYGLMKYIRIHPDDYMDNYLNAIPNEFGFVVSSCPIDGFVSKFFPLLSKYGQLKCLKYLWEHCDEIDIQYTWNEKTCISAAKNGHLDCLIYVHENGCPWSKDTCAAASSNGHLDCLKYARNNGCSWDTQTCIEAAKYGHLNILTYAKVNGCHWNMKDISEMVCDNGHLDCLKYLHSIGLEIEKCSVDTICKNGHLYIIKYLWENGNDYFDHNSLMDVISGNHLDCLKYLHFAGLTGDNDLCHEACASNTFECFKFLHSVGYLWNHKECDEAAKNGYLNCLIYAHENGCQWSKETCILAMDNKQLICLKYLIENGCPIE